MRNILQIKNKRINLLFSALIIVLISYLFENENILINKKSSEIVNDNIKTETVYKVVKVVDGDTIDIMASSTKLRVRLLGINTPESVDPKRKAECYGKEASDIMKNIVLGKEVYISYDINKPKQDEYNRELSYVYLLDGTDVAKLMLEFGAAYEYTYKGEKYEKQEMYKEIAAKAKKGGIGLWSQNTCAGKL